jgi:hypothetical protein
MNRVIFSAGRPVAVAIVFLCLLALTLCQILGPTARLNHAFAPTDLAVPALVASSEHFSGAHNPLPSRCAALKLAPLEIKTLDFAPAVAVCEMAGAFTSTLPQSVEVGVPTPPPRQA